MIGSAIRKPRIHPGRGSASADSMMDGRMMVIGSDVAELGHQGPLAEGLGVRVGVGPAERLGAGLADLDHLLLDPVLAQALGPLGQQVEPGAAQLLAGRLVEAAPAAPGWRDSASVSPRWRRAAVTSVRQSTSTRERVGVEQLLSGLALVGAGHVGRRHRDEVDRARAPVGLGQGAGLDHGGGHPGRARAG